jgi:thiol-disulfide isomerase/thioredoxin
MPMRLALQATVLALALSSLAPGPAWADRPLPVFPGPTPPAPDILRGAGRSSGRPWLGVAMDETPAGVVVREVIAGSPAETAALQAGDLLDAIDGAPARTSIDVVERVLNHGIGGRMSIRVLRAGTTVTVTAVLTEAPAGPAGVHQARYLNRPAPAIEASAPTLGLTPTNTNLRGRVTVLDFWATWCRPCRAAMRVFADWHRRYGERGLSVIGLTDEEPALVAAFAQATNVPYALATDVESRTARRYAVSAIPTMFILDRTGVVRRVSIGASTADFREAEALIQRLLAEPIPPPPVPHTPSAPAPPRPGH